MNPKVIGGLIGGGGLFVGFPSAVVAVHEAIPEPPWMGLAVGALIAVTFIATGLVFAHYGYKTARIPYDLQNQMAKTDDRRARDEARLKMAMVKRLLPGFMCNQATISRARAELKDAMTFALTPNEAKPTSMGEVMRIIRGQMGEAAEGATAEEVSLPLAVVKELPPADPPS